MRRTLIALTIAVVIAAAFAIPKTGTLWLSRAPIARLAAAAARGNAVTALDMQWGGGVEAPGVTSPAYARATPKVESGGRAVAHYAGGRAIAWRGFSANVPVSRSIRTGFSAGEPTLGIDKNDTIFFQTLDPSVMRSTDLGKTWKDVSPMAGSAHRHPTTLDPYLYLDPRTGRVFTYDFLFGCSEISFTDDEGKTWTTSTLNCGLMDHQNLFAGPPVSSPTVGYPDVVYTCSTQAGATIYSVAAQCEKSLDGGVTWAPTGEPAFVTNQQAQNDLGVDGYCHGAIGHGYVGPDGTVYIPKGFCGQPWLAISHDEGATWTRVQVAKNGMPLSPTGVFEHEASVAADAQGNVYYFWIGRDRLPYLAISRNEGKTWSDPMMIGAPGVKEAALPHLTLGATGKLAIVYYGSTNSPGPPFPEGHDCKTKLVQCMSQLFFLNPPDPPRYKHVTWNAYMTVTADALDAHPVFYSAPMNDPQDPMVRGTCGPIRCKAVYDFIGVVIDKQGRPWSSLVDACVNACAEPSSTTDFGDEGVLGTFVGGPSLR